MYSCVISWKLPSLTTWTTDVIFDSSKFAISPTVNLDEFRYAISTFVADDLVTTWATAPLVDPITFSPNIDAVSRFNPVGKVIESRVGELVFKDSYTPTISTISGRFSDIELSSTLVPKYVLVVNPLTSVDAADTVLLIVIFSLLIYSFFLFCIPTFLAVTFTTTLDWLGVKPVNLTESPPFTRVTWSDVKSSIVPSPYET